MIYRDSIESERQLRQVIQPTYFCGSRCAEPFRVFLKFSWLDGDSRDVIKITSSIFSVCLSGVPSTKDEMLLITLLYV